MTVAFVASEIVTGANGGTSASVDSTGGNFVVVSVSCNDNAAVTSVSDNKSNTYTPLTSWDAQGPHGRMWYCENATCGTGHTFTISGTSLFTATAFAVFSGVKTSGAADAEEQASSIGWDDTNAFPGALVPSEDNMLVVAAMAHNAGLVTAVSGMTITESVALNPGVNQAVGQAYVVQTTATSVNPQFTGMGSSAGNVFQATFKADPGVVIRAVGTLVRETSKPLAAALTPAGQVDMALVKPLAGALVPASVLPKVVTKNVGGTFA